jgi:feruloyl-CoA synthase
MEAAPRPADPFFDNPRRLAPRRVQRRERPGGGFVLSSPVPLAPHARCVGEWLERWAHERLGQTAVAEPLPGGAPGWRRLSWRELRQRVGAVAQALLDMDLPAQRPVVVLSDNSVDHFVLLLAGQHIGRPVCSVSSGYSRLAAGDFSRLRGIVAALQPALVYGHDAATYGAALADIRATLGTLPMVLSQGHDAVPGALPFAALESVRETPAVMAAFERLGPDDHAKYLLTSGSTGVPKVVINTHRMLCANQQMLAQTLPFLANEPPVLLDWLPWSHTFGANHNSNLVLCHGGTLHIDDGRPMPGLVEKTLAHLRGGEDGQHGVQPTVYFNVPRGYEAMLPMLEADAALARRFFERLQMVFYAGAGMPISTWQRLEAVAARVRERPVWFTTSWGSTETAPAVTFAHWKLDRPGVIGLPMPGVELKFTPSGEKLELRVRGPNIFPGYLGNPVATAEAFDDEGYYRIGDAGRLRDEADALQGVVFDGRVAEDFKLGSGTWVSVGTLRLRVVAALSPWVLDAAIAGHDRSEIGLLVFLSEAGRRLAETDPATLRQHLRNGLAAMAAEAHGASSQTPRRLLVQPDAPSLATGELTDKGYLNQRLTLARRAAEVERLYTEPADAAVVML